MAVRRFPPPWSVEEQATCFVVRDHSGQQLAYIYFEDEPGTAFSGQNGNVKMATGSGSSAANKGGNP